MSCTKRPFYCSFTCRSFISAVTSTRLCLWFLYRNTWQSISCWTFLFLAPAHILRAASLVAVHLHSQLKHARTSIRKEYAFQNKSSTVVLHAQHRFFFNLCCNVIYDWPHVGRTKVRMRQAGRCLPRSDLNPHFLIILLLYCFKPSTWLDLAVKSEMVSRLSCFIVAVSVLLLFIFLFGVRIAQKHWWIDWQREMKQQ